MKQRPFKQPEQSMTQPKPRCLILACGNTLRSDDGIGPWLADWAEQRFQANSDIHIISRHQWTPELAEDVAHAESVLFIDCSANSTPGSISLIEVQPATGPSTPATHHIGALELLGLARDLYNSQPRAALLLTVGAGSLELGELFSQPVLDAIPLACKKLEEAITNLLAKNPRAN
jgi:hydrogenase maturation protease